MTYLKAGITVVVTSWENDADNYRDKFLTGLSKECALAVGNFCNLFSSRNNQKRPGLGNSAMTQLDFDDIAKSLSESDLKVLTDSVNFTLVDLFYELVGDWCEGEYSRVVENVKYLNVPFDIEEIKL